MLEIKKLSKSFHENKVLDHINLKIEKGDVVGIIGPSGTGKSTLLRCINQLEIPEEGEAVFGGKTVDLSKKHKDSLEFRKSTGMVFQRFYLFWKKTEQYILPGIQCSVQMTSVVFWKSSMVYNLFLTVENLIKKLKSCLQLVRNYMSKVRMFLTIRK